MLLQQREQPAARLRAELAQAVFFRVGVVPPQVFHVGSLNQNVTLHRHCVASGNDALSLQLPRRFCPIRPNVCSNSPGEPARPWQRRTNVWGGCDAAAFSGPTTSLYWLGVVNQERPLVRTIQVTAVSRS